MDTPTQDISHFYTVFLANLNETHPGAFELLRSGAISVPRSFGPSCRQSMRSWQNYWRDIPETWQITWRTKRVWGRVDGDLINAYHRFVKTAHENAQYLDVTYSKADMQSVMRRMPTQGPETCWSTEEWEACWKGHVGNTELPQSLWCAR